MRSFETVDKRPLYSRVAETIIEYIRENEMQPGEELPSEGELCEKAGVSRVVVRGALGQLAGAGLIQVSNGRRPRVGELNSNVLSLSVQHGLATTQLTVQKIMEVREGVEVAASKLAALRRTDAQAEVLAGLCREMEAVGVESLEFVELDFQFHLAIAQATDNPLYIYIVKPLRETIKKSIEIGRLRQRSPAEIARINDQHWEIQRAITSRDGERAANAMLIHLETAAKA
ncbi:FadR family transcriptional regulator [Mesorhizobium sp. M1A.F.Ca.IN.022.07.1.1]|uniref:FadR/GntR family transcriptional regulator n=1 Tax=unclassified Mesorhizobium TaxID=325217 RepID=UPI000FCAC32E|nr:MULTISPECIES: FadR/GntR family transcriptional regulator [unclassified Mesorhizobium]RUV86878.1 FadR family transcriptional regulator [Mesorhizobium sp. M1A.F.Ca.IN.022.07.1.1]RWM64888.1 MAG: FadR family transcriptional regulator [Mesorhizobium sp.]RWM89066.1 MAG: FadR family transcriptional regulator [Mesorhizobium sp.]TIS70212.1 MAG: FCD domain-containing protein [Mesorhizobium sp.]TJV54506.1 MAG: FCD domain-containing protein [Mesorhizobium sp.]